MEVVDLNGSALIHDSNGLQYAIRAIHIYNIHSIILDSL